MVQIQHILLFAIITVCTCVQATDTIIQSPNPGSKRTRRNPVEAWPAGVYPKTINTYGGKVWKLINGQATKTDLEDLEFTATGKYNDRPLYTSGPTYKIYYRLSIGKWVLGFSDPGEEYSDGTIGISSGGLFSSDA